jgi:hypothetical protein
MADKKRPLYQRLDACEAVIPFEISSAGAANVDPTLVGSGAFHFLRAAADHAKTPEPLRLRCLRLLANLENIKASSQQSTTETLRIKRELLVTMVNAVRRQISRPTPQGGGTGWDGCLDGRGTPRPGRKARRRRSHAPGLPRLARLSRNSRRPSFRLYTGALPPSGWVPATPFFGPVVHGSLYVALAPCKIFALSRLSGFRRLASLAGNEAAPALSPVDWEGREQGACLSLTPPVAGL